MTRQWSDLSEVERRKVLGKPGPPEPTGGINGARVKMARELQGWSVEELAERLDGEAAAIRLVEDGGYQPAEEMMAALVACLGFPLAFFKRDAPPDFPQGTLLLHQLVESLICDICEREIVSPEKCQDCGNDMCPACQEIREGRRLCLECVAKCDERQRESHLRSVQSYWFASPEAQRTIRKRSRRP